MQNNSKPKLVFFRYKNDENLPDFLILHKQQHVQCLSEFFEITVISENCDYQQICDQYHPDITLFESGVNYRRCYRLEITNTHIYPEIPKLGFHNGDSWCEARAGFISDMERWGIEAFFSIATTTPEHTPEIAENTFIWPNFIDPQIYHDYGQDKTIPVMFTGGINPLYPWRQRLHKLISQNYPSLICPHLGYHQRAAFKMLEGEQYARTINSAWFVPTCGSIEKEIIRKHLEIPGSKSCLITEKTPVLESAGFVDMQNCVFADEDNVLDKLDYLFHNLDKLSEIIDAGYQLVHTHHTFKQRDQIYQWFNLQKHRQSHQKIIQTSPFGSLSIVEKSSGIQSSHIIGNGLILEILRQGDEKLWAGEYAVAESAYLKCVNHIYWMPEPKLRLAICHLYQGDAKTAYHWITQPIQYTLEEYKALDPDPVEWAYLIITLLCQGELNQAVARANEFTSLIHPELDRIRWVVKLVENPGSKVNPLNISTEKHRLSVHQLPERSLDDWLAQLCKMLQACEQSHLVQILTHSLNLQVPFLAPQKSVKDDLHISWLKQNLNLNIKILTRTKKSSFSHKENLLYQRVKSKLNREIEKFIIKPLNNWEDRVGYFLPYNLSSMRHDEVWQEIHNISQENIQTVLVIGAGNGQLATEALLAHLHSKLDKINVVCLNTATKNFQKLQKRYRHTKTVVFYTLNLNGDQKFSVKDCVKSEKENQAKVSFDLVLIDIDDLQLDFDINEVYGANYLLINNVNQRFNYNKYQQLIADMNYITVSQNLVLRKGYALFKIK
ncbi:glycosyltransferase/tetratricopeptide repeat domain-containing protein [Nostoc cycadae WK-1]|uniref:Glycosyltransferase/tetratricopeptide repeat domain-containing protein n=2 Tax=Nostoc cycadae TaxID=246795 RepID=A0A2H6LB92_9NOSO|nr:glycosyltransferase/tetratricopeptide repeat domain-containing protein [Nostoc cycadae WK-1]